MAWPHRGVDSEFGKPSASAIPVNVLNASEQVARGQVEALIYSLTLALERYWDDYSPWVYRLLNVKSSFISIPKVVSWLADGRLKPENMITQVFAAADAREAFDLIEKDPQRTLKVQLDFS